MDQASLVRQQSAQPPVPPLAGTQGLEPDVQAHLGRQLRAVYDEMASQPVPDRFLQLLDALEKQDRKPAGDAEASPGHSQTATRKAGEA